MVRCCWITVKQPVLDQVSCCAVVSPTEANEEPCARYAYMALQISFTATADSLVGWG